MLFMACELCQQQALTNFTRHAWVLAKREHNHESSVALIACHVHVAQSLKSKLTNGKCLEGIYAK